MGNMILELVLSTLRSGGFRADLAYPGRKYPDISEPVAAVHILRTDGANRTVTAEVFIVCRSSLGGTRCETEAVRAAQLLGEKDADCILEGCKYDGITQTYSVRILAVFREEIVTPELDFQVFSGEIQRIHATRFCAVMQHEAQPRYAMGESAPAGISPGSRIWKLTLEERIPPGEVDTGSGELPERLTIVSETGTEVYSGCCWTSIRREFTRDGLHIVHEGLATGMEVTENG